MLLSHHIFSGFKLILPVCSLQKTQVFKHISHWICHVELAASISYFTHSTVMYMPDLALSPVLNYSPTCPPSLCVSWKILLLQYRWIALLHLSVLSLRHKKFMFCQFHSLFPFEDENTDARHALQMLYFY